MILWDLESRACCDSCAGPQHVDDDRRLARQLVRIGQFWEEMDVQNPIHGAATQPSSERDLTNRRALSYLRTSGLATGYR